MSFGELKTLLRRRTSSWLAFVFLLLGLAVLIPLVVRAAFAQTRVLAGGGFKLVYSFTGEALGTYFGGFLAVLCVLAAAGCMLSYIFRGKRSWQIGALVLTVAAAVILLVQPAAVKEGMFFYEFIDYRFSFMHSILFVSESWFDIVIQSLKFLPLLAAAILTVVGLCRNTSK